MSEVNRKCKECGTWVEDTHEGVPFVDGTAMCMDCFREDYKYIGGKVMDAMKRGGLFDEEVEASDEQWFDDPEWIEMNRGEPFDVAWDSIAKAPFREIGNPHRSFEGVDYLYSGGHADDEPAYWTDNLDLALMYALFGSAVPKGDWNETNLGDTYGDDFRRTIGGMRETIPTIWRIKQSHNPDDELYFEEDFASDALYGDGMGLYGEYQPHKMDSQEVANLINDRVLGRDNMGGIALWDSPAQTTQAFFPLDDVLNHAVAGLNRLHAGRVEPGSRLEVPAEALPFAQTAYTDWHGHPMEDDL